MQTGANIGDKSRTGKMKDMEHWRVLGETYTEGN
jgi:hypothetical protein